MSITSGRGWLLAVLAIAVIGADVVIEAQKPVSPAAPPVAFDRYHSPQEANAALIAINKANPAATALYRIATSPGGIDLTVLEIGPDVSKKIRKRPAVFVVANMEGLLPLSAEAALSLADRVLADASATKSLTWFFLPNGSPDAATRYFRKPLIAD